MGESTNEKSEAESSTSTQEASLDHVEEAMRRLRIRPRKMLESLSHLRINRARIRPIETQAPRTGGKADVVAAILTSAQPSSSLEPEYIAIKKLRFDTETDDDRALAPLVHEVKLLNDLSHSNVVNVIGFVEDVNNGVAWIVFRWERNGNLREFVRSEKWELPERVSLIRDVAQGLSYLHGRNPPICHGDLKSLNILVNSKNRAVITDFGSARVVDLATEPLANGAHVNKATHIQHQTSTRTTKIEPLKTEVAASGEFITMTGPAWTVRWAAPELLDGGLPGLGSDIWAFGWICWEVVTGNFPFHDESDVTVIRRIMTRDLPNVSKDAELNQIKMLCSLMEDCLRLAAKERPPAIRCQQVVSFMNPIIPFRKGGDSLASARSSGLLYALGRTQVRNGMMDKAQEYFQQSLKVSESVGDDYGKARAVKAVGDTNFLQSEYFKAEESYIQSRDLYCTIGNQLGFAHSLKALGDVYRKRSEYSKAEESYIQSRDLYSKIGNQLGFAHSLKALGSVYWMRDEYSKAEESYIQSRDLYSKIGYQHGFAHSLKALGDVYRMRGEYSKAEQSYIQSRDLHSKIGNQLGLAHSLKALGDVYWMRDGYSKAEASYIQTHDLYSKIGNQLGFAHSLKALGDVYRMRGEYPKAEESYIQSRDLYSKLGNQLGFAGSLQRLGQVHSARGEYAKARESYLEAQHIYHRIGDRYSSANVSWYLAWLHRKQAQYDEARRLVGEASTIYGELGLTKDVADCDRFLLEIGKIMRT